MNDKKLYISCLYDYYGALLSEKQQYAVEMYYNDDLSLAEIAESIGITRQGVRDQLKHAEAFLVSCEEKLGFYKKLQKALELSENIKQLTTESQDSRGQSIFAMSSDISELLS